MEGKGKGRRWEGSSGASLSDHQRCGERTLSFRAVRGPQSPALTIHRLSEQTDYFQCSRCRGEQWYEVQAPGAPAMRIQILLPERSPGIQGMLGHKQSSALVCPAAPLFSASITWTGCLQNPMDVSLGRRPKDSAGVLTLCPLFHRQEHGLPSQTGTFPGAWDKSRTKVSLA